MRFCVVVTLLALELGCKRTTSSEWSGTLDGYSVSLTLPNGLAQVRGRDGFDGDGLVKAGDPPLLKFDDGQSFAVAVASKETVRSLQLATALTPPLQPGALCTQESGCAVVRSVSKANETILITRTLDRISAERTIARGERVFVCHGDAWRSGSAGWTSDAGLVEKETVWMLNACASLLVK